MSKQPRNASSEWNRAVKRQLDELRKLKDDKKTSDLSNCWKAIR